ncbi:peptidylprolyl isomerase [Jatrophihabitans sp. DSM 45814]
MSTSKQRRDAARRHLERQLERRQQRDARRRQFTVIGTVIGVIVIFAIVITSVVMLTHDDKKTPAATGATPSSAATSPAPSASSTKAPLPSRKPAVINRAAKKSTGPCGYTETAANLKSGALFDTGLPPDPKPTPTAKRTALFNTNLGTITVELDGAGAPCNVQSIEYLISKKFYDNTGCPRSVNSGIFVVQCGDPSGTTSGGPSYTTKDENLSAAKYTEGALAMANSGANTNGSQFFFITKDSSTTLGKNYTVIGHVTGGLDLLQKVATGGDDGSNSAGGGRPNVDLIFKTVTLKS